MKKLLIFAQLVMIFFHKRFVPHVLVMKPWTPYNDTLKYIMVTVILLLEQVCLKLIISYHLAQMVFVISSIYSVWYNIKEHMMPLFINTCNKGD